MLERTRKVYLLKLSIVIVREQLKLRSFVTKEFLQFGDQTDRKQSLIDLLDESSTPGFFYI